MILEQPVSSRCSILGANFAKLVIAKSEINSCPNLTVWSLIRPGCWGIDPCWNWTSPLVSKPKAWSCISEQQETSRLYKFQHTASLVKRSDFISGWELKAASKSIKVSEQALIKSVIPAELNPVQLLSTKVVSGSFLSAKCPNPISVALLLYEMSRNWSYLSDDIILSAKLSTAFGHPDTYKSSRSGFYFTKSCIELEWSYEQSEKSAVTSWVRWPKISAKQIFETWGILLKLSCVRFGARAPSFEKKLFEIQ